MSLLQLLWLLPVSLVQLLLTERNRCQSRRIPAVAKQQQRSSPEALLLLALRRNLKNFSINGGFRGGDFSVRSAG